MMCLSEVDAVMRIRFGVCKWQRAPRGEVQLLERYMRGRRFFAPSSSLFGARSFPAFSPDMMAILLPLLLGMRNLPCHVSCHLPVS